MSADTKQESRREIAERIVNNWKENHFISALNMREGKLITLIEFALKDRDERAAKIVNNARFGGEYDLRSLAHAIRNEDANA